MKPLYIHAPPARRVCLDGPALRVRAEASADQWFPLRRISRVVAGGAVQWETAALLACADSGITISFLEADGEPRARLLGKAGERDELPQRLSDLLDRPDGFGLYGQWKDAMCRREARFCAWRLRLPIDLNNRALAHLVRRRLAENWGDGAIKLAERRLRGLLFSTVTARLQARGLSLEVERLTLFPHDLVSMLIWHVYPGLLDWAGSRARKSQARGRQFQPGRLMLTGLYENQAGLVDAALTSLLNRLHRWLVEIN